MFRSEEYSSAAHGYINVNHPSKQFIDAVYNPRVWQIVQARFSCSWCVDELRRQPSLPWQMSMPTATYRKGEASF